MSNYKIKEVRNKTGIFKDEKIGNVVYIPQRNWTNIQKAAMTQFLNPSNNRQFYHSGNC